MKPVFLVGLTVLAALTSRLGYTDDQAKALEEVRALLKKVERNSAELEKRNQAITQIQADEGGPQKPAPRAAPSPNTQDCLKLSGVDAIKTCLIQKITETQAAQKEIYEELD